MISTEGAGRRPSRVVWLAYVSGAFGLAMSAQVNFLVPVRARELGASFDVIGLIVASGALAAAALSVASGALIDRLGSRRGFVLGAGVTAIVSALYVFVGTYWWLLALQPVLGAARNLGWVASQSYITSLAAPEERATFAGRFSFFSNGGQVIGPVLIGGVAQLVDFRWAFLFMAGYAAVFTIIGFLLAEMTAEDHHATRSKQGTGLRSAIRLAAIRGIQVALLLTFARLWISWVYTTFFPVYLIGSGLEPGVVGTVMATSGVIATVLGPTTGFWTRGVSQQGLAVLGLGCGAAGLLFAPHVSTVPVVYLVPALVGVGTGLSLPLLLSIVTSAAPAEQRGVALGLRGMVNQTAATAAPLVVGPLIAGAGMILGFTIGGAVAAAMLLGAGISHARSTTADVER